MRSEIVLLTHAEAEQAQEGRFAADAPLTPRGRLAAARYTGVFAQDTEVLVSPSAAARETALVLALAAQSDPRLADLDLGQWNGRAITDIAARTPDEAAAWIADPHFAGHGGESIAGLLVRVGAVLEDERTSGKRRLAITHGAVLRAALAHILEAPASAFWKIDAPPLTRLRLTSDGRRWSLRELGPLAPTGSPASPASG